jgi:8-oxo-dGTP pyrophosphatase MutT (NUDIX family)
MPLHEAIKSALAAHRRKTIAPGPVPAAVLLPLFRKEDEWHILFTKRTKALHHHGGEISFPGGVCQPDDTTARHAALRETWEEVGIPPRQVEILGVLDDVYSIHNYLVTPYVGIFPGTCRLVPNSAEIEKILEIPLEHLLDPSIFRTEDWSWQGRVHPVHFYSWNGEEVWGLTASILKQFLDIVFPAASGAVHADCIVHTERKEQEGQCLTAS